VAGDVPWEVRVSLRAGTVYYFADSALTSAEPHYFIVVNARPLEQEVVILTVCSSKVEGVRRRRAELPGTLVEMSPMIYGELKKETVVDCNTVFRRSLAELVGKIQRGEVKYKMDLPAELLGEIQAAVRKSPLVENEIKLLLE
jgi:hypothetical protein